MSKKPTLRAVPPPPEKEPEYAGDIYAEVRAAALDSERWRRLHERSNLAPALEVHQPPHKRGWVR